MKTRNIKYKKNIRKTKRRHAGNFFKNVFFNLGKDKNIKDNYYETEIEVDNNIYKLNYFTPSNFVIFKTTNQMQIPVFNLFFNKTQKEPIKYKIKIKDEFVNTIIKIKNNWYVITRTLDIIRKYSGYYRIYNVFTNNQNEKLYLKNSTKYKIEDETIIIPETKYMFIDEKKKSFKLLIYFDSQQDTGEVVKEVVATDVAIEAADEFL